mgnify:CR=1 FL=1
MRYETKEAKQITKGDFVITAFEGFDKKGDNIYEIKNKLLFSRTNETKSQHKLNIGIARALNMFEEFPFWHTLFTECGLNVILSDDSNFSEYEKYVRMVMSDNICFPAKLTHSHIANLQNKKVDRIFMPFVIYEKGENNEQNSYNCPIVTAYSTVIGSVQNSDIPLDTPTISFRNRETLLKQCLDYLTSLGIKKGLVTAQIPLLKGLGTIILSQLFSTIAEFFILYVTPITGIWAF